jgi:hypothetical protein
MASALPGEKKQKKTDGNNNFFILDMPMNADGREDTWLGVAFEDRKRGTHERYTPQGPGEITIEEVKEEVESTVVSTYSALSKGLGWATGSAATEASSVSAQVTNQPPEPPLDLADVTYRTPCR